MRPPPGASPSSRTFPPSPNPSLPGLAGFDFGSWAALLVPAAVVAKLNASAVAALADPAVASRLAGLGYNVIANSPEESAGIMRRVPRRQHPNGVAEALAA